MAVYFSDSGALAKRYIAETGSKWFSALFAPAAGNEFFVAAITRVEIIAALSRRVRGNNLSITDANSDAQTFRNN